jgi:hypothetical protein
MPLTYALAWPIQLWTTSLTMGLHSYPVPPLNASPFPKRAAVSLTPCLWVKTNEEKWRGLKFVQVAAKDRAQNDGWM